MRRRWNSTLNDCSFETIYNPQYLNEISTWWRLQYYWPEMISASSHVYPYFHSLYSPRFHCQHHRAIESSWSLFWSQLSLAKASMIDVSVLEMPLGEGGGGQRKNKAVPPDDSNIFHDICCQVAGSFKATNSHLFLFCFILMDICFTSEYTTSVCPCDIRNAQVF